MSRAMQHVIELASLVVIAAMFGTGLALIVLQGNWYGVIEIVVGVVAGEMLINYCRGSARQEYIRWFVEQLQLVPEEQFSAQEVVHILERSLE